MTKTCQSCGISFEIIADDARFYERVRVPVPTWCPECRMIRRYMRRNERALYKRACGLCGAEKISMFSAASPFTVYCKECWRSDAWDAGSFGRAYDFSKQFFAQWGELLAAVPRQGIIQQGDMVDSEYVNRSSYCKGCYLVSGATRAEYCRYGTWFIDAKDSMDCYNLQKSERCYSCVDCANCYNLAYSRECDGCSDGWLLLNCRNCQNCIGCVNARNKKYCIFNEQYTREEYEKRMRTFGIGSFAALEKLQQRHSEHVKRFVVPWAVMRRNAASSGSWIQDCKNVVKSFNCRNVEDAKFCSSLFEAKDAMDYSHWGNGAERIYECMNVGAQAANCRFLNECWTQIRDAEYCMNCENASDLFGCIGLRNKQYCILNMQYSKNDYEGLVTRIRAHMRDMPYSDKKGRVYGYGEFFPPELSVFAYNETLAQEFFPLSKEEALAQGYAWKDPEEKQHAITLSASDLPDHVRDVGDDIAQQIIGCGHNRSCKHQCTGAFKILPQELAVYRAASIPLPRLCPNCRHFERIAQRPSLSLYSRNCMCGGISAVGDTNSHGGPEARTYNNTTAHQHGAAPCRNEFETSYAPDDPEMVYCEECYNAEVV